MHDVKLGEKRRLTLPKAYADSYGLKKGDQLRIIDLGDGILEIILLKHSTQLPPPAISTNVSATIEDMSEVVADAIANEFKRASDH